MTLLDLLLCLLAVTTTTVLIILTVYAVKLMKELTSAAKSVKELTDITKSEIKPALISLNEVLNAVKNVSATTNKQFETVKNILTTVLGASCIALSNVRSKGGFFSGLISGFNIFRKKRR